ncbi:antitoxin [Mycobacterium fragae]|nr:antitoxin [Mycobacterium fragae]
MREHKVWRRIADPVVAAPPAGVRIRTRINVRADEAAALTKIGTLLGELYRTALAERIRCGVLDGAGQARWRAERKRALTAVSSSRWAGAITRAVEDQYQLGMRVLAAHVGNLQSAVDVLAERCALRPGEVATIAQPDTVGARRVRRGYRDAAERFAKTRRLAILRERLVIAQKALDTGRPSITVGGKRLWRNRSHLNQIAMSEQQWRRRWDSARMFVTADGESGKAGGNETIRVDANGILRIKVPVALAAQLGSHVVIAAPVRFVHRGDEWADRVATRQAIRYDIHYEPERRRWYLDASWKADPQPPPSLVELRAGCVVGVDLNADHLAACILDRFGNVIGTPITIPIPTAVLPASRRDGHVRTAITALLNHAERTSCTAVVIENLDFADARAIGREILGRGVRAKRFRRTVAGIPTRRFRNRLVAMAARRGIAVIGVDAAYTSVWGEQHWRKPLRQQASDPATVTRHHGAAAAIGRRGLGMEIRRRPAGPRNGQRTAAGTPPDRPDRHFEATGRCGSFGPPTRPLGGDRSTEQHPPAAVSTVRAATPQDSPLLTNQERSAIGKDGLMGFLDKAKQLLSQNADKVEQAIDKAGDIVDDKTSGKYKDAVDKVQDAAKKAVDKGDPQN